MRLIAELICRHLVSEHPDAITTAWDTGKRTGKVFLDFNMNVRGKSTLAPYCPRGLAGAPVSMPLSWSDLAQALPMQFRIGTVTARTTHGDPWRAVLERKQSLEARLSERAAEDPGTPPSGTR